MPKVAAVVACVALAAAARAQDGAPPGSGDADAWRWRVAGIVGRGRLEYDAGPGLDGSENVRRLAVRAEAFAPCGLGAGLAFEAIAADPIVLAPIVPSGWLSVDTDQRSLFAHVGYDWRSGGLDCPLRVGVAFEEFEQSFGRGSSGFDYGVTTLRLEVEPDVALAVDRDLRWSLYARGSIGYGEGEVEGNGPTRDASVFERCIEVGTRLRGGPVEVGVAWIHDVRSWDDETSFDFDVTFSGVLFSFGAVF